MKIAPLLILLKMHQRNQEKSHTYEKQKAVKNQQ